MDERRRVPGEPERAAGLNGIMAVVSTLAEREKESLSEENLLVVVGMISAWYFLAEMLDKTARTGLKQ